MTTSDLSSADRTFPTPNRDGDLPEIAGFGWRRAGITTYDCGTKTISAWRKPNADDRATIPSASRWELITACPGEYLDAHGVEALSIPKYYTDFGDEFELQVFEWTVRHSGVAVGVDANLLERMVRLANGPGHIDHDAVSVYRCDTDRLFVVGPRGSFLVDPARLRAMHVDREPPSDARTSIRGFEVPEDDPVRQRGLRRFIDGVDAYSRTLIDAYEEIRDGKHVFWTVSDRPLHAQTGQLRRLGEMAVDQRSLTGAVSVEFGGEVIEREIPETAVEYDRGETVEQVVGQDATVLGFDYCWEPHRTIDGTLDSVELILEHVCLRFSPDQYHHFAVDVVTEETTIDTIEV